MDNKEKVQDFLNNRIPFYIDENVRIKVIKGDKSNRPLIEILQDQGYSWISTIRGYIMDDHAMLYVNDFQTPNCNTILIQALFAYFPNITWIGLGCLVGNPGEIWEPRLKIYKNAPLYEYV